MILDLKNYHQLNSGSNIDYVWRMEVALVEKLTEIAEENKSTKAIVLRYILDWSCNKVEDDEEYREHMLEVTMYLNKNKNKKKTSFTIEPSLNDRLLEIRKKYRILNLSYFINESIRLFVNEYEK